VTVLALEYGSSVDHAMLQGVGVASSRLLEGFTLDVAAAFAAGRA
jgi:hypothetical protein